jgi:hypothetical protein
VSANEHALQPVVDRGLDGRQADLGVIGCPAGRLAVHRGRLEAVDGRLHRKPADRAVAVARPDDQEVGDAAVGDPALGAVLDVALADPAGSGLQRGGVGPVGRFGHGERTDPFHPGQGRQPAPLRVVGAEHVDGEDGQLLDRKKSRMLPSALATGLMPGHP